MARTKLRRAITAAAVLTPSLIPVLAGMQPAGATTSGAASSPFTASDGDATIRVIGGGTVTLPVQAYGFSWSPDGSRVAYIDYQENVYTADADGSHPILIAAAEDKVARGGHYSHTTWSSDGAVVFWSERKLDGSPLKIVGALGNGDTAALQLPLIDAVPAAVAGQAIGSAGGDDHPDVASDGSLTFEQMTSPIGNAPETGKVMVVGPDGSLSTVTDNGLDPTISPDGKTVAFKRWADPASSLKGSELYVSHRQADATWSAPTRVTFEPAGTATAATRYNPVFGVDGRTLAFVEMWVDSAGVHAGVYSVDTTAATASANPETNLGSATGSTTLAVRTDGKPAVRRVAGLNRYQTAVQASQLAWRTDGDTGDSRRPQAKSVTLSRSDLFADALGGSALAAHENGPLLITDTNSLPDTTLAEIKRILPVGGTVYLLGGDKAISPAVATKLSGLGYHLQRVAGANRYATSVAIADTIDPNPQTVLVATGDNFPDALSAGAVAAAQDHTVVVLTNDRVMPSVTAGYLNHFNLAGGAQHVIAIGGQADAAIRSAGWSTQTFSFGSEAGADRYQTSYMAAHDLFPVQYAVGVATGADWPDALSGGALMGRVYGPLLLVDPHSGLSADDRTLLDVNRGSISLGLVFGGTHALPGTVDQQVASAIASATGADVNGAGFARAAAHASAGSALSGNTQPSARLKASTEAVHQG